MKKMKNILLLTAFAVVLTGCLQDRKKELGAEDTVKAFYESLCKGEFAKAESLCDTLSMKEYLENISSAWEKNDSLSMTIVPAILSETKVQIGETEKDGQQRTIFYELVSTDGSVKEKTAVLFKEEGVWKVRSITDRI